MDVDDVGTGSSNQSRLARWRSPSPRRDMRRRDTEQEKDGNEDSRQDRKGKGRATCQELDREMDREDRRRRYAEEQDTERACLHVERAPIPPQVAEMQRRELDMEHPETVVALRDQISMNVELL